MNLKYSKASVIGGLVGLVLSETVVHIGQSIHGGTPNPQLRLAFDTIDYAVGAAVGSLIIMSKKQQESSRINRVQSWKDLKPVAIDYALMLSNAAIPAIYGIYKSIQYDGQLPYIY